MYAKSKFSEHLVKRLSCKLRHKSFCYVIKFVNVFVIAWKNSSKQNSTITAADMSARSSLIMHISVDGKDKKNDQDLLSVF